MNYFAHVVVAVSVSGPVALGGVTSRSSGYEFASALRAEADTLELREQNPQDLQVSAGVRFVYTGSFRTGLGLNTDLTTVGFGIQDATLHIEGQVTDSIRGVVSFDFTNPEGFAHNNNPATLEDAYADWAINDGLTLRLGQFRRALSAGQSMSEYNISTIYRSPIDTFVQYSKGIEAHFGGDRWSGVVGFTPDSRTTSFGNGADYAFNARFDLFSDSDKARFADRASWRGSSNGWRLGVGGRWSQSPGTTRWAYSADGAFEGDGWQVNAAYYIQSFENPLISERIIQGVELGGSMFVSDRTELFARYDNIYFGSNFAPPVSSFSFLTCGVGYYFIPESNVAKLSAQISHSFDGPTTVSNGGSLTGFGGFLADSDAGETLLVAMIQFIF